jgi:hypothetical protein
LLYYSVDVALELLLHLLGVLLGVLAGILFSEYVAELGGHGGLGCGV